MGFNNPADGASREVAQCACWSQRQAFNNPVPVEELKAEERSGDFHDKFVFAGQLSCPSGPFDG